MRRSGTPTWNWDTWRDQDLLGTRSLNLLNANQDPSYLRSVLYLEAARDYIPALKANFMRVVINGESWGVYVNQQTFSKEFLQERLKTTQGSRWKSPNNSVGGGFSHLGDDIAACRKWYEMKGANNPDAWRALANATKILNDTPLDQLEKALEPVDVDAVLRFLAIDVALVNGDGYWRDGSDFNVYLNEQGRFWFTPHDANEGFRAGGRASARSRIDSSTGNTSAPSTDRATAHRRRQPCRPTTRPSSPHSARRATSRIACSRSTSRVATSR